MLARGVSVGLVGGSVRGGSAVLGAAVGGLAGRAGSLVAGAEDRLVGWGWPLVARGVSVGLVGRSVRGVAVASARPSASRSSVLLTAAVAGCEGLAGCAGWVLTRGPGVSVTSAGRRPLGGSTVGATVAGWDCGVALGHRGGLIGAAASMRPGSSSAGVACGGAMTAGAVASVVGSASLPSSASTPRLSSTCAGGR